MIRAEPQLVVPHIRSISSSKNYRGQELRPLTQYLKDMPPLNLVVLDEEACRACEKNTEDYSRVSESHCYIKGGNRNAYKG